MTGEVLLSARGLSASYGQREVFRDVSLQLTRGMLTALIGPNGSGKTTLLHVLSGIHREATGEILLQGRPLQERSRREIARDISLVPQFAEVTFEVTVEETVALGRYPWLGPLAPPSPEDREAIERALAAMDLGLLRGRSLQTLSGGEKQRVYLARALAQTTPILLLDEPVASLDLRYQQETYERLQALAKQQDMAILVADHHLNLVAATCDQVVVLHGGAVWALGSPTDIVTEKMIRDVFGARMQVQKGEGGRPQCLWVPRG
ncbi:MAG: ABC transporter ATP-binding protein [Candidatus Eisenbacteria sp.]|nr:ABC transporter ATP-binding protein [Candidatus Eisenbacteria bacterium]